MLWHLKSCGRCSGDLALEEDFWRCWQCGHHYYPKVFQRSEHPSEADSPSPQGHDLRRRKNGYGGRADKNINSMIRAKFVSDERWWTRNQRIIAYLDGGWPVREIALVTERGPRQIRVIRERLADLRAHAEGIEAAQIA